LWEGDLYCPCGEGRPFTHMKYKYQKHLFRCIPKESQKKNDLDHIQQQILTLRCPHCNIAVYDFDGCLSIKCLCEQYFCALCFEKCLDNHDCHDHVLRCNNNQFYMDSYTWHRVQYNRKNKMLMEYFYKCWRETNFFYVIGLVIETIRIHNFCSHVRCSRFLKVLKRSCIIVAFFYGTLISLLCAIKMSILTYDAGQYFILHYTQAVVI
jgi:hypothetical protein